MRWILRVPVELEKSKQKINALIWELLFHDIVGLNIRAVYWSFMRLFGSHHHYSLVNCSDVSDSDDEDSDSCMCIIM